MSDAIQKTVCSVCEESVRMKDGIVGSWPKTPKNKQAAEAFAPARREIVRLLADASRRVRESDLPVSIFDIPPPEYVDLRDVIRKRTAGPMNYWDSVLLSAASAWYTQEVKRHYDEKHRSGEECDCE